MDTVVRGKMMFSDEHIVSFLFRMQLMHGYFDFSNFFALNGKIRQVIQVPKDILALCRKHDERHFIYAFSSRPGVDGVTWGTVVPEMTPVGKFLKEGEVTVFKNHQRGFINFCLECIKESLEKNGVGYLKKEWLVEGKCKIHNKRLPSLECSPCSSMVDALSDLLVSGVLPHEYSNYEELADIDESQDDSDYFRSNFFSARIFEPSYVYIKKCANEHFACWIRFHIEALSRRYYLELGYKHPNLLAMKLQEIPHLFVPILYQSLLDEPSYDFKNYVEQSTEICSEYVGVFNKRSIPLKMMKLRGVNCYRCPLPNEAVHCRSNGVIVWFRLMYPVMKDENTGIISMFTGTDKALAELFSGPSLRYCPYGSWWRGQSGVRLVGWTDFDIYYSRKIDNTSMESESGSESEEVTEMIENNISPKKLSTRKEIMQLQHQVIFLSRQNTLLKNFLELNKIK